MSRQLRNNRCLENAEEKAIRAERKELSQIPADAGVYFVESGQIKAVPLADWKVETSNKRKALQMVTPIPIVAGKATVLVKGEHASFTVDSPEPEFYIRLDQREDFGIHSTHAQERPAHRREHQHGSGDQGELRRTKRGGDVPA